MSNRSPLIFVLAIALAGVLIVQNKPGGPKAGIKAAKTWQQPAATEKLTPQMQRLESKYTAEAVEVMDLAPEFRQRNRAGSCVHASTVMLLRWVGLYELADYWWNTYRGGEGSSGWEQKARNCGLRFVITTDGDLELLEWAIATRRGAGITWSPSHVVNLVGSVEHEGVRYAVILNNNTIDRFTYQKWDEMVAEWRRRGGWAFALVFDPPPPVPK